MFFTAVCCNFAYATNQLRIKMLHGFLLFSILLVGHSQAQADDFEFLRKHYYYVGISLTVYNDGSEGILRFQNKGRWNTLHELNRSVYFKKAFDILPEFLADVNLQLPDEQLQILRNIQQLLETTKTSLYFTPDQGFFRLNEGEVTRTASTTSSRDDLIMINRLIANDPSIKINFADAFQLLLHEIGHKVEKSSQADMDMLAAKLRSALEDSLITKTDPKAGSITILRKPFLVITENGQGVQDQTEKMLEIIKPKQNFLMPRQPIIYESQKGVDKKLSVNAVEVYFGPLKNLIFKLNSQYLEKFQDTDFYYRDVNSAMRASALTFESHVQITGNTKDPFKLLSSTNPFYTDNTQYISEIKSRWINEKQIEFMATLPEGLKKESADLLIENGKIYFRLKPSHIDENGMATWRLNFDQVTQEFPVLAQAVVIKSNTLVFSTEGILIKIPAETSHYRNSKLQLKSIQIKTDEPEQNKAGPAKILMKLHFRSRTPIKEVRIAVGKTLSGFADSQVGEPYYSSGGFKDGYPHNSASPSGYKTEFEFLTLTDNEFSQKRVGDYVEVTITREEYLKHYSIRGPRITKKISWFYSFTHNHTKRYIGLDEGYRRISHIEAVNASLEQVSTKWQTSVGYRIFKQAFCHDLLN